MGEVQCPELENHLEVGTAVMRLLVTSWHGDREPRHWLPHQAHPTFLPCQLKWS
jgi:hypothetical protein